MDDREMEIRHRRLYAVKWVIIRIIYGKMVEQSEFPNGNQVRFAYTQILYMRIMKRACEYK